MINDDLYNYTYFRIYYYVSLNIIIRIRCIYIPIDYPNCVVSDHL